VYTEWDGVGPKPADWDEQEPTSVQRQEVKTCDIWDERKEVDSEYDTCKNPDMPTSTTEWITKALDDWIGLDGDEWVAKV
jgi:hypothetical protein